MGGTVSGDGLCRSQPSGWWIHNIPTEVPKIDEGKITAFSITGSYDRYQAASNVLEHYDQQS